jgi:hypothetical protein
MFEPRNGIVADGIEQSLLFRPTFCEKVLPHDDLAAHGGVAFQPLLSRKQRLRVPVRLKAISGEVKGRIDDDEPFVAYSRGSKKEAKRRLRMTQS